MYLKMDANFTKPIKKIKPKTSKRSQMLPNMMMTIMLSTKTVKCLLSSNSKSKKLSRNSNRLYSYSFGTTNAPEGFLSTGTAVLTDLLKKN